MTARLLKTETPYCLIALLISLWWAETAAANDEEEVPMGPRIEYMPAVEWPEPPIVTPGQATGPPADAVVLFDGTDLSDWINGENWTVEAGVAIVGQGDITSKKSFGDCQLHIEWSAPELVEGETPGTGQGRGNSGVFLMDTYEVQVLDSYDNQTYYEGQAGAVYKQIPPLVNAMRPPGEWNTYDIIWTAPRFNRDGSIKSPAFVTALHNGVLILNHFELLGNTPWSSPSTYTKHDDKLPIRLQDHGNPVRYRNIWVRELHPIVGKQVREPYFHDHNTGKEWTVAEENTRSIVKGSVNVAGQPLEEGVIVFHASDGDGIHIGEVTAGQFVFGEALTRRIPPGEYTVTVRQRQEEGVDADSANETPTTSIPRRYRDKETSSLRLQVAQGPNLFALDL